MTRRIPKRVREEKCPPLTEADLAEAVQQIEASNMEKARAVEANGALCVAVDISKAISLIDISKTCRKYAGDGGADAYLDQARTLLLSLIGIEP